MSPQGEQRVSQQGGLLQPPVRRRWGSTASGPQGDPPGGGQESTVSGLLGVLQGGRQESTASGLLGHSPSAALLGWCYGQQSRALGKWLGRGLGSTLRGLLGCSGVGRAGWPLGHTEAGRWERVQSRKQCVRRSQRALKAGLVVAWDCQGHGLLESTWGGMAELTYG